MKEETAAVVSFPELGEIACTALSWLDQVQVLFEVHDVLGAAHVVEGTILLAVGNLVRKISHHLDVTQTLETSSFSCHMLVEVCGRKQLQTLGAFHT